jgi:tetratricopeptide (TPR) repeat protein
MRPRSLLTLALVLAIAPFVRRASADEPSDLAKGRYAYGAGGYDEADAAFRAMLAPTTGTLHDSVLVNEARMYWGATLVAKGQTVDATRQFEAILAVDPKYEPDPAVFPVQVGYLFIDTRARFQERARQLEEQKAQREKLKREQDEAAKKAMLDRLRYLETLAAEDRVVEQHSRWIAFVPFGAGQFENGQTALGFVFGGVETLLLAGTLVTVPIYLTQLHDSSVAYQQGLGLQNQSIAQQYLDRANQARIANLAFNGALYLTMIVGVVQAQIAFEPEVQRVRTRPHDPGGPGAPARTPASAGAAAPTLTFGAAPVFGGEGRSVSGAVLGVSGSF